MGDLPVLNVYETAAVIGREVEKVIDECGSDAVANLMPHVIRVLEQLESVVQQKEQDTAVIEKLEEDIVYLKSDGDRKNEDNVKLQLEIQQLEELIKKEEMSLMNTADKIQKENQHLKRQLSEKQRLVVSEMVQEQETIKVLNQMKETVDKQRDDLRRQNVEMRAKTEELEALQQQVDRYFKINKDLLRKNQLQQDYAKNLIHENSDLQSKIAGLEQEQTAAGKVTNAEVQAEGQEEGQEVKGQVNGEVKVKETGVSVSSQSQNEGTDVDKRDANMQWVNLEGKQIIDKKDPNRPRFTLKEMSKVLEERDNVKMRIMELEDELEAIRGPNEKSLEVATPEKGKPGKTKENSDSPGIKRFFSGILKKLSPQKKPSPGYKDGVWEVLDPNDNAHVITTEADCYETSTPTRRLTDCSLQEEEEDGEEVHLEPYPDDTSPLVTDGGLSQSLDAEHFSQAKTRQRNRSSVDNITHDQKDGMERRSRTQSLPADQIISDAAAVSIVVDVNGNSGASGSKSRPPECSDNEVKGDNHDNQ